MRTRNFTAITPVCLPPEICSPIPTPTRLVLGSGLVEAARAENAVVCTGCKSCCAAACLAALSDEICLSERPVKMIVELLALRNFLAGIKAPLYWARMVVRKTNYSVCYQ